MPKSRREPRHATRGGHHHRRARKLPPRAPASWAELVEKVLTDPAAAETLRRLRWSFYADGEPRYLDTTGSQRLDEAAAEGRFIEWAVLDFRPVTTPFFEPFNGLGDWLDANGVDLSLAGPFAPWVRSVGGAFMLDTYHAGEGVVSSLGGGRTFNVQGLAHLKPSVGDVLVGRLLPATDADDGPWTATRTTVLAPAEARQAAHERRAQLDQADAARTAAEVEADRWPLMSETWLGASPWWPSAGIGLPMLVSDTEEFFDAVGVDLSASFLLSEFVGLDDPLPVWSRLYEDLPVGTPTEFLLLASFVTALWATTSPATLHRLEADGDEAFDEFFRTTALKLALHAFEREADSASTAVPLPTSLDGAWVPSPEQRDVLAALPRTEAVWSGERRPVQLVRTTDDGVPEYWHVIVWADEENEDVLATSLCPAGAPHDEIWRVFAQAATQPLAGDPRLPAAALCTRLQNAAAADAALSTLGVNVDVSYEATDLDDAFLAIEERLAEDPAYQANPDVLTQYLALPTNTPGAIADMCAAAVALYRLEPWTVVSRDLMVSLVVDDEQDARLSGWGGEGPRPDLKIYRNMWTLLDLAAGPPEDEEEADAQAEAIDAIHVSFPAMKAGRDPLLREAQAQRWPMARDRYPVMVRQTSHDGPPRLVCGDEVPIVTAMLHAWRTLVETHRAALAAGQPCGPVQVETHGHRVTIDASHGPEG